MKNRITKYNPGFSLIELLVAIAIFSIGFLGIAGMQAFSINNNALSNEISQATLLAQAKIESLQLTDFTHDDLSLGSHSDPDNPVDGTGLSGGRYYRTWQVKPLHGSVVARSVWVTVSWQTHQQLKSVNVNCALMEPGI